jgi:hypothetical protein
MLESIYDSMQSSIYWKVSITGCLVRHHSYHLIFRVHPNPSQATDEDSCMEPREDAAARDRGAVIAESDVTLVNLNVIGA